MEGAGPEGSLAVHGAGNVDGGGGEVGGGVLEELHVHDGELNEVLAEGVDVVVAAGGLGEAAEEVEGLRKVRTVGEW